MLLSVREEATDTLHANEARLPQLAPTATFRPTAVLCVLEADLPPTVVVLAALLVGILGEAAALVPRLLPHDVMTAHTPRLVAIHTEAVVMDTMTDLVVADALRSR